LGDHSGLQPGSNVWRVSQLFPEPHQSLALVLGVAGQVKLDSLPGFVDFECYQTAIRQLISHPCFREPTDGKAGFLYGDLLVDIGNGHGSLAAEYAGVAGGQGAGSICSYCCGEASNILLL